MCVLFYKGAKLLINDLDTEHNFGSYKFIRGEVTNEVIIILVVFIVGTTKNGFIVFRIITVYIFLHYNVSIINLELIKIKIFNFLYFHYIIYVCLSQKTHLLYKYLNAYMLKYK